MITRDLPYYKLPKCGSISPTDQKEVEDPDKRGLICLLEPPRRNARYVMGVDPCAGITGWDREHRTTDDLANDNGSIEVIRCGNGQEIPDVQVAEYAAPVDAEDLADVAALLGRMYCGNSDSGEALAIIEIWPGPGLLTQRRLMNHFNYQNFFRWEYLDTMVPKATNTFGWQSTPKTLHLLWTRYARHYRKGLLRIRTATLMDEMRGLQKAQGQPFPEAVGELARDDRVRAASMAVWAAHDWILAESSTEQQKVTSVSTEPEWQSSDCSSEDLYTSWEERFSNLGG